MTQNSDGKEIIDEFGASNNAQDQSQLPEGWDIDTIGALSQYVTSGARNWSKYYSTDGALFIRTQNIKTNSLDLQDVARMELPEHLDASRMLVGKGDLLYTITGANVGKCAVVKEVLETGYPSQSVALVKVIDDRISRWLHLYSISPSGQSQILNMVYGLGRPILSLPNIRDISIPIAPKAEQTRIVKKIESLQARSTKTRALLAEVKPLIAQLRQSVLRSAFNGSLTADWRAKQHGAESNGSTQSDSAKHETASELLQRIRVERRERWETAQLDAFETKGKEPSKGWRGKYKEPEPLDETMLPELPQGWCWASFEEIANIDSNLVPPERYLEYPHIAPDNIEKETGRLLEFSTIAEDKVKSNKNHFFPGQIIYSKIRPYLSKVIIAEIEGLCSADMYPISTDLNTHYLYRYMLSDFFLGAVQEEAGNRVVLPKVNKKQLYNVPVPLAPALEQAEISMRINESTQIQLVVSGSLESMQSSLSQLDQSILSKAFRGELVPQDPNDEPASELLDRIRDSRKNATVLKKSTKKTPRKTTTKRKVAVSKSRLDDDVKHQAYLAKILKASKTALTSDELFKSADLQIADYYKQLEWEVKNGYISENPEKLEAL